MHHRDSCKFAAGYDSNPALVSSTQSWLCCDTPKSNKTTLRPFFTTLSPALTWDHNAPRLNSNPCLWHRNARCRDGVNAWKHENFSAVTFAANVTDLSCANVTQPMCGSLCSPVVMFMWSSGTRQPCAWTATPEQVILRRLSPAMSPCNDRAAQSYSVASGFPHGKCKPWRTSPCTSELWGLPGSTSKSYCNFNNGLISNSDKSRQNLKKLAVTDSKIKLQPERLPCLLPASLQQPVPFPVFESSQSFCPISCPKMPHVKWAAWKNQHSPERSGS